jgi:hypothetical protein
MRKLLLLALRGDRSGAQSCYYTSYGQCMASLCGVGGPAFAIRIKSAGRAGRAIAGRIATEAPPRLAQHLPATVSRPSCSVSMRSALVTKPVE